MLDAQELLSIQQDAYAAACDTPCTIKRGTRTSRASGGGGQTWNTVSQPNFPNGVLTGISQPSAGQLQNFDYLVGSKAAFTVRLPVGVVVQEQDRLTIAGETLEVAKVLQPRSYSALVTCLCVEVK